MYNPKVEIQYIYIYQFKVELQERINKRERERAITFFFKENVRQITKLYKRRQVEEYSKENL